MEITLEMIEQVKDRTGVSYKEAKEALERTGGNVVDAIIDIEEKMAADPKGQDAKEGKALIEKVKELVKKGNVSKISIKKDDEVVMNLPVNAGIVAGLVAPWASLLAIIAAFGFKCEIEVVKDDGSIIDVSRMTTETVDKVVEKGAVLGSEIKSKSTVIYETVKEKGGEAYEQVKEKVAASKEQFDFDDDDDFSFSPVDDVTVETASDDEGVEVDKE